MWSLDHDFLVNLTFDRALCGGWAFAFFQVLFSVLVRQRITDATSGFRAYSRRAVQFLSRYYPQDYPEPEAIVELHRNGFRIAEAAVGMRPRESGRSSIRAFSSIYYIDQSGAGVLIAFSRRTVKARRLEHEL